MTAAATRFICSCICSCFAFRRQPNGLAGDMAHWLRAERPPFQDGSAEEQQNRGLARPVMAWQCGDNLISKLPLCNKKNGRQEEADHYSKGERLRSSFMWFIPYNTAVNVSRVPGNTTSMCNGRSISSPLQQTTSGNTPVLSLISLFCTA